MYAGSIPARTSNRRGIPRAIPLQADRHATVTLLRRDRGIPSAFESAEGHGPMETRRFATGETLFDEGGPVDRVFRVRGGAVEIVRQVAGQTVVMGTLGPEQFVGEMAAIERRPRHSATARAATATEADLLTLEEFLDQIEHAPGVARTLIERLSRRLHAANERIVHDEAPAVFPSPAAESAIHNIQIAAGTVWLQRQIPEPVAVSHLPFVVGRRPVRGERPPRERQDLLLEDYEPFRLSRDHFTVIGHGGSYFVRDMGSTLGTVVNEVAIGEHFRTDEVRLREGKN